MKLRLLGTGGADGIPAMYSDSELSRYAREHGGKDVRLRSSALIDGHLKIDLGPDTLAQIHRFGLDARDWTAVFFTHSHDDHFCVTELQYCLYPFNDFEFAGYTVFGNEAICRQIHAAYPDWPFEVVRTKSFCPVSHAEYTVTPVRARHASGEDCQNLLVADGMSTLLYATDTGIWEEETWEFLQGKVLHGLVIECTEGFAQTNYDGHLDVNECIAVVERLREQGTVTDATQVVTTHHAHTGNAKHAELEAALRPHGIEPGYDGLEIDL